MSIRARVRSSSPYEPSRAISKLLDYLALSHHSTMEPADDSGIMTHRCMNEVLTTEQEHIETYLLVSLSFPRGMSLQNKPHC